MELTSMFVGTNDTDTHRICGTCNQVKPVSEFYKDGVDKQGKSRYRRDCKECYKTSRMLEAQLKKGRSFK